MQGETRKTTHSKTLVLEENIKRQASEWKRKAKTKIATITM